MPGTRGVKTAEVGIMSNNSAGAQSRTDYLVNPVNQPLQGRIRVPGDKSISHRVVILASLAEGVSDCSGFLDSADTRVTVAAFRDMGVPITQEDEFLSVDGAGLHGLSAPSAVLDMGNSGTSARLLLGVLAGQRFASTLTGDESLAAQADAARGRSAQLDERRRTDNS